MLEAYISMGENLECHFNWDLVSDVAKIDRNKSEEKLLASITCDVTLKGKTHLLLSFMYATNDVTGRMNVTEPEHFVILSSLNCCTKYGRLQKKLMLQEFFFGLNLKYFMRVPNVLYKMF